MNKLASEWVDYAEEDLVFARNGSRNSVPLYGGVCFHCQQCAEKYLKAILIDLVIAPPRTHNLEELMVLLLPHHPQVKSIRRGLTFLTGFAVNVRYPGKRATKRQMIAALRWIEKVRTYSRTVLGLGNPKPKRKK